MPVICGSPILPMGPLDVAQERARVWSHEVPRGSLGHWVEVSDGLIKLPGGHAHHVERVPRGAQGQPGPYEQAPFGTPVADPKRPLAAAHGALLRPLSGLRGARV